MEPERRRALLEGALQLRQEQELARQHPAHLLDRVFMVDEKTGEEFRFYLNDPESGWHWQREVLDELQAHQKTIILKARQLGITWLCAGYQLWMALTRPGTRHLVFRQNEDDSVEIIRRIWQMYESIPSHLRYGVEVIEPRQGFRARTTIAFRHPDGRISTIIGKVATERAGRGPTVATVLFDEAAFIDKFRGIWSSTLATMGTKGKTFVVSTANGVSDEITGEGNYYHRLWVTSEDKGLYQVFLGWDKHPERDQVWYDTSQETRGIDERERAQEYPSNPDEAFRLTTATWYDADAIEEYAKGKPGEGPHIARPIREIEFERKTGKTAKIVQRKGALIKIYREPVVDLVFNEETRQNEKVPREYAIGADIATGRGKDFSAAYVIDLTNMELVAELHGKIDTDKYALQLHYLGMRYHKAWIAMDRTTGWGESVITYLRDGRDGRPAYSRLYQKRVDSRPDMPQHKPYGIQLNEQSRPNLINQLGSALRERSLPWITSKLCAELKTFVEHQTGITSPAAQIGSNDDCVIAACLTLEMYRQYGYWPDRRRAAKPKSSYKPWLPLGNAA